MSRDIGGRGATPRPAFYTITALTVASPSDAHRQRRRIRLHHELVRRARWSRELDRLCGIDRREAA